MTKEDKQLLLQDLCARLPYGVKGRVNTRIEALEGINIPDSIVEYGLYCSTDISEFIPYLFPLSSMTKEQKGEIDNYFNSIEGQLVGIKGRMIYLTDFLNKNHFDYRGLIEKGLANDATKLNIY